MAAAAATGSDMTLTLLYMALIVGVFYFLWFRPQQTQRKKMREMLEALAIGDRVMTAGGMIGTIRAFAGETISVEIAPGVVVDFTKRAVIERVVEELPASEEE
jgi:preprotein translocase subunit YajC